MTRMYFVRIKGCSPEKGTHDYDRIYRLSLSHVTIMCKKNKYNEVYAELVIDL